MAYNENVTSPPSETDLYATLAKIGLPPLRFRLLDQKIIMPGQPDAVLEASAAGMPVERFAVEYKRQWTPRIITAAVADAEYYAKSTGLRPLIVVPYLSDERLLELEGRGVSGLDLCGNGIVVVPGQYTVFRSGKPNLFKTTAPIKNIYRGTTSMVPRAFLLQSVFGSVGELADFIRGRGGAISAATVSKALQGMADDLLLRRDGNAIQLLQPQKLLTLLERNFVRVKPTRQISGRLPLSLTEIRKTLSNKARPQNITIAATGVSSAPRYIAFGMEEQVALYCRDADALLSGIPFEETTRFPNLQIIETDRPTVYFDIRRDEADYPWASPVQTYLEMADGEPRTKQSAESLRRQIIDLLPKKSMQ